MDSTQPDFWNDRYAAARTPWDLGRVPAALDAFIARSKSANKACVLIPGCGSGYEVRAFADAGYDVTAIDFSPVAVARARALLGKLGEQVLLGDFFTHQLSPRSFDFVYERTFLCSLPPERWPRYVRRMHELLAPGGKLIGLFVYGSEPEPPPYPLTERAATKLFTGAFELTTSAAVTDSPPMFAGMERWQEWVRLGS